MSIARLLVSTSWSGAIGCIVATALQLLMELLGGHSVGVGGLVMLPVFALFYMIAAVPATVVMGTIAAPSLDRLGVSGLARTAIFTVIGGIAAPVIWAALIEGSTYFSSDPRATLSIGLSCGLACALATRSDPET